MRKKSDKEESGRNFSQLWNLLIWMSLVVIFAGMAPSAVAAPLEAAAAAQNSVTLSWTAPGDDGTNGTATAYSVRYSTSTITQANWSSAFEAGGVPTPGASGTSEAFEVTGLSSGTLYYFAIRSVDEAGNWSGLSNVVSASTDVETDPPAVIANLQVVGTTASSLTLQWTAPGDDGNIGTASAYELRYSTSPITALNFNSALLVGGVPAPQSAGSTESIEVTGLESSTQYYFAIITADEVPNWSGISNVANGTTDVETIAPSAIANLVAQNATETTIELTWTAPGDDANTGQAAVYEIRYSTTAINNGNFLSATLLADAPVPAVAGSTETITVTGLSSATVYYFAIKTADEVPNWSGLSNVVNLSTGADQTPPAAVGDLSVASN